MKHLTDKALLENTLKLVHDEREILVAILHHLREIERRKLYSMLKYSSLFEYAINELKYSEAQAMRRISAMRLLRDLPQIEEKIASGALSLTNLALAQALFTKEKGLNKIEVLAKLENKTTRAAQKIVCAISPQMKSKRLNFNMIEDDKLREKLLQIKGLYAHIDPNMDLERLLHKLCDEKLLSAPKVTGIKRKVCT